MSKIRIYDPERHFCNHGLVSPGKCCPECLWQFAASGDGAAGNDAIRQTYLRAMLIACLSLLPRELHEEFSLQERRGAWYALQFAAKWAQQQKRRKDLGHAKTAIAAR